MVKNVVDLFGVRRLFVRFGIIGFRFTGCQFELVGGDFLDVPFLPNDNRRVGLLGSLYHFGRRLPEGGIRLG